MLWSLFATKTNHIWSSQCAMTYNDCTLLKVILCDLCSKHCLAAVGVDQGWFSEQEWGISS